MPFCKLILMAVAAPLMAYSGSVWGADLARFTRLAEAECSAAEIASITGHSMRDVGAILDLYLARTGKIALAAIAKLERGSQ